MFEIRTSILIHIFLVRLILLWHVFEVLEWSTDCQYKYSVIVNFHTCQWISIEKLATFIIYWKVIIHFLYKERFFLRVYGISNIFRISLSLAFIICITPLSHFFRLDILAFLLRFISANLFIKIAFMFMSMFLSHLIDLIWSYHKVLWLISLPICLCLS